MPRRPRPKSISLVKNIGQHLARARKERGLTQIELAKKLGVSQANVSSYERGGLRLPADLLIRLSEVLDKTTDELLGRASTPLKKGKASPRLRRRLELLEALPKRDQDALSRMLAAFEDRLTLRQRDKEKLDLTGEKAA